MITTIFFAATYVVVAVALGLWLSIRWYRIHAPHRTRENYLVDSYSEANRRYERAGNAALLYVFVAVAWPIGWIVAGIVGVVTFGRREMEREKQLAIKPPYVVPEPPPVRDGSYR